MKNNNLIVKDQLEKIKSFVDFKTNLELYIYLIGNIWRVTLIQISNVKINY